jgi:hypothetical protein
LTIEVGVDVQWYRIAPHAQPPENSLGILLTIRYHPSGYSEKRGSPSPRHAHGTSDEQKILAEGMSCGTSSSEPAGTTAVFPLRLILGTGLPQRSQNHFAKLSAEAKSNRRM